MNPWTGKKRTMTEETQPQPPTIKRALRPSILLREYMQRVNSTDKDLPKDDLRPVLMGLFGEVGSVLAATKKHYREKEVYVGYNSALVEEFGDVLWYFTALCRRLDCGVDEIFLKIADANGENCKQAVAASDLAEWPLSQVKSFKDNTDITNLLLKLGQATASLLPIREFDEKTADLLHTFAEQYLRAIQSANVTFADIVHRNVEKIHGRFSKFELDNMPNFDKNFPKEEQLPQHFEIEIKQRKKGKAYMRWNGVFIGDPLTDNMFDKDGYRFHDVFHLSYAAILHWSPIFRALIKQKRKSVPEVDENQDGGRAKVVEEGLSAWIFSRGKDLDFFENTDSLPFDLLKVVQEFVRGYEVEQCPLSLWEHAILEGYKVFREVRKNEEGIIIGDRSTRTISYKPIEKT